MATIGAGGFNPVGVYSSPGVSPLQTPNAGASFAGPCSGPAGLGYGRQMLGDIDVIMALMALLQQGATAPTCGNEMGANQASLGQAGAKGIGKTLGKAGAKGAQGALKKAPGKAGGAATLAQAAALAL